MKKIFLISALLLPAFWLQGQMFIGTEPTENPVALEVKSADRGVLLPRINLPDTLLAAPVVDPPEGLMLMNTHPGKEGLYFWNGKAWEKLTTDESIAAVPAPTGKTSIFIGVEATGKMALGTNKYTSIPLKATYGTLTNGNDAFTIPSDGVYEIMVDFKPLSNRMYSVLVLNVYNYTQKKNLAHDTLGQDDRVTNIAAQAIYSGFLKQGDRIGVRVYYGTKNYIDTNVERVKALIFNVKKISLN